MTNLVKKSSIDLFWYDISAENYIFLENLSAGNNFRDHLIWLFWEQCSIDPVRFTEEHEVFFFPEVID